MRKHPYNKYLMSTNSPAIILSFFASLRKNRKQFIGKKHISWNQNVSHKRQQITDIVRTLSVKQAFEEIFETEGVKLFVII